MVKNRLNTHQQHGFLSKLSTTTNLLESVNDWSLILQNRHVADIIYLDFAKAFDKVSHSKLLLKLKAYGIGDDLISLITDFLSNSYQRVVLPSGQSSLKLVTSGVPQGSVLGPLLFLIYVNDILDLFCDSVSVKLFADDKKMYTEVSDLNSCVQGC